MPRGCFYYTMSRIVRTGTKEKPYRLTKRDLPDGYDLSYSHFEYVDASGLDLSTYNLSLTDWYWCNCAGVKLPVGGTEWLLTRETSWFGAGIPADLKANAISHDLLIEAYRQGVKNLPTSAHPIVTEMLDYLDGNYAACLSDAIQHVSKGGFDLKQLKTVSQFASRTDSPDLMVKFDRFTAPGGLRAFKSGRATIGNIDFDDGGSHEIPKEIRRDRWLLARELEKVLEAYHAQGPWEVEVKQVEPYPLISSRLKNPPGPFV